MRTAVVTGGARGIGLALAAKLVREGVEVVLNDLDEKETVDAAAKIGAVAVPGDAASATGVASLVAQARARVGAVDAWFANAGIDRGRGLATSEEDWTASLEVNVLAHVRAARLLVPDWVERGAGRFVVTASAAGLLMMVDAPAYTVSKHGAVAFAEWLSATYRHRGVVVQAVCPQGVTTRMLTQSGVLQDVLSHDGALTPEQVADLTWEAVQGDRFLVLPHPEVGEHLARKGQNHDRWLVGMNRLQQRIERTSER